MMRRLVAIVLAAGALLCAGSAWAAAYDDFAQAVKNKNPGAVTALLKRGMDLNTVDANGQAMLHICASAGDLEVVQALVGAGADVDKRNAYKETAIMLAALQGRLKVVEYLLSKDAQINHPGWTPLLYAATNGHDDVIKILLENYAYIDSSSPNGTTPLMMAVRGGHVSTVLLLLEEGADPVVKNENGDTALSWAVKGRQTDMAEAIRAKIQARH